MKVYQVTYEIRELYHGEIEAEDYSEAIDKVAELSNDEARDCFEYVDGSESTEVEELPDDDEDDA